MKKGELKKVALDYEPFFGDDWKRVQNDFVRRQDSWVQIVAFHPSRWASEYHPVSSLDFLRMPGETTGGLAISKLTTSRHGVQRWVTMREHEQSIVAVFDEMVNQFRPHLLRPLDLNDVLHLVGENLSYWPHPYTLCITACERGDVVHAREYFEAFVAATRNKPYPEIEERRLELLEALALLDKPERLLARLNLYEVQKLAGLRL